MLHGGFGTLTFFGIASRSAKNHITTQQIATKERVSVHTQTYVSGYGAYARTHTRETARTSTPTAWEDTYTCSSRYYDANGDFCGSSQSSGTDKELHTIYYDANGHRCGTSVSGLSGYYQYFETTYYNTDDRPCGKSTGRGYDTTYYLPDGRDWDTSKSDSSGNTTYATPRQIAEREEQERTEHAAIAERERIAARERRERSEREARDKAERERIKANEKLETAKRERERPIPRDGVGQQVRLLSRQNVTTRVQAQSQLLSMGPRPWDGQKTFRPGFSEQIKNESLPIINAMMRVMTEMQVITNTRNGRGGTPEQNSELNQSLILFGMLPFTEKEVQATVLDSKVISFLVKMKIIYAKRGWNYSKKSWDGTLAIKITEMLGKIAAIDNAYKSVITEAEGLNRKIPQLKTYYLSKAGFFNASGKIFEDNDYDAIVGIIQNRAKNKPDGASAKTIQHFRLG